jgi:uncharacterized hydrophobic protein (TIGR00271 family)
MIDIDQKDRYHAVDDLIDQSKANATYYTLLLLSTVIITAGLLLANSSILIGGMLVTPVLTPILLIALGIVAAKPRLVKRTSLLILKSTVVIFAVAVVGGWMFHVPEDAAFYQSALFNNRIESAFLYFIVAFASGVAATFSWIRKEVTNILPGISIAVALVPPLSLTGIWLATGNPELMRFFLMVFLFNLIGIVMGAMIVFSMLRFYGVGKQITKRVEEEIKEQAGIEDEEEVVITVEKVVDGNQEVEKVVKEEKKKVVKTEEK